MRDDLALDFMIDQYGHWGEHPTYQVSDWKFAVTNDDTRLGYWEWVADHLDEDAEEGDL